MFPKAEDQHKLGKPLVPNGLGVLYVLVSVIYLFVIYSSGSHTGNGVPAPLILAVCILFGGFMGMLDDWIDLKWRYKAFLPLIAAIPLGAFVYALGVRTTISLPFLGTLDFGLFYFFVAVPLIVTVVTNTINQLGGLNGLETVCPAIIMVGLAIMSVSSAMLLLAPFIIWAVLAFFNVRGRIFVGNTGSFSVGLTLAAFAVITDLKFNLLICIIPYIFNSCLVLLTFFFFKKKASVTFDGKKLRSDHRRSLITLITYKRQLTEMQVVLTISFLVALFTILAIFA